MKGTASFPLICALSILLASGCANQQPAAELDTDTLCKITVTDPDQKAAAEAELGARQASCDWQKVSLMMNAEQAERDRKTAAINQLLQAQQESDRRRQEAYRTEMEAIGRNARPLPPTTNCTTTYIGNQAHTSCR